MVSRQLLVASFQLLVVSCLMSFVACTAHTPLPDAPSYVYEEDNSLFANPERGWHTGTYYSSDNLTAHVDSLQVATNRLYQYKQTLYLHVYYLTDYVSSDIPQAFIDRMQLNFNTLRVSGAKCIVRFSYKSSADDSAKPWDATPESVNRHIDQVAPVLCANADVILGFEAGFIGVWGEWYYTTGFPMDPDTDAEWAPRWEVLNHMLASFPQDRQIALRTPGYKMQYLRQMGYGTEPLNESTAHKGTAPARISAHNDCFLSSSNDVGTYNTTQERAFWQADTRFTLMGGETCMLCGLSDKDNAIAEMERYHWTYLNRNYNGDIINKWRNSGALDEITCRLGYRIVMEEAYFGSNPRAGQKYQIRLTMHNAGFAAMQNPRDVELIFARDDEKYVYKQNLDPRFWLPDNGSFFVDLYADLDPQMAGVYAVYLNLPDPYPSIHDNPNFSVRLANKNVWQSETGYNRLGKITIK